VSVHATREPSGRLDFVRKNFKCVRAGGLVACGLGKRSESSMMGNVAGAGQRGSREELQVCAGRRDGGRAGPGLGSEPSVMSSRIRVDLRGFECERLWTQQVAHPCIPGVQWM
jgi:hypothetical protein